MASMSQTRRGTGQGKIQMFAADALLCVGTHAWTLSFHDDARFTDERQRPAWGALGEELAEEGRQGEMFADWMGE